MITSIRGPLAEATPLRDVIELSGLSYEVNIPVTTAERLPAVGQEVKLDADVAWVCEGAAEAWGCGEQR